VVNAFAIDTLLFIGACDIGTGVNALAIPAELADGACDIGTGVRLTKAIDTALAIGTAAQIAIIFDAFSFDTDIIGGAIDQFTGVYTSATYAFLIGWASNFRTGVAVTDIINALHTRRTLTIAAAGATRALIADHARGARSIVVGNTVAVIISAIADFWFGLWCVASNPLAILARFSTRTTRAIAWAAEIVIDQSIAVVIFAIADLWFWGRSRTAAPFAVDTSSSAVSTISCAFARGNIVVDQAVTIVVFAIADLGFGLRCIAIHPTTADTCFCAFTADRFADASEAIIDLAIAIIVDIIADLWFGLGGGTFAPSAFITDFDA
jgi:hypothetical protein